MAASPVPHSELELMVDVTLAQASVRCTGRITSNTTESLRAIVRPLIVPGKTVELDLTDLSYMDSSGLGAVVGLFVTAKREGCRLKLINMNERIKELFSITRLGQMFIEGRDPDYPQLP